MLEFFNYRYIHRQFSVNPSCRQSKKSDDLSELEVDQIKQWEHSFKGVCGVALYENNQLRFIWHNKKIIDGEHIKLEEIIKHFDPNSGQIEFSKSYTNKKSKTP